MSIEKSFGSNQNLGKPKIFSHHGDLLKDKEGKPVLTPLRVAELSGAALLALAASNIDKVFENRNADLEQAFTEIADTTERTEDKTSAVEQKHAHAQKLAAAATRHWQADANDAKHSTEALEKKSVSNELKGKATPEEQEVKNLADYYHNAFEELKNVRGFFPEEIFPKDLVIAIQCQESRGKVDAQSHTGAKGVMQNMRGSIKDVHEYLKELSNRGVIKWQGPKDKLTDAQVSQLEKLIMSKSKYGRAFGKLYLARLWSRQGVGKEWAERGDFEAAQNELLASFNAGPGRAQGRSLSELMKLKNYFKSKKDEASQREYRAYNEAVTYINRIRGYQRQLATVRSRIKSSQLNLEKGCEDYLARELTLKLDYYQDKDKTIEDYLLQLKKTSLLQGKPISYSDIDKKIKDT